MSKRQSSGKRKDRAPSPHQPMDVVDGIPDRAPHPRLWHYVLLAAIFCAWVAFLIYSELAGKPH